MVRGSSKSQAPASTGDTAEKKPKKFNNELFLGSIEGILRSEGIMAASDARDDSGAFWDAIGSWSEVFETSYEERFGSVVEAVNDFETWLEETKWTYTEPVLYTNSGFTITITMQAPSGQLSVAMACNLTGEGVIAGLPAAIKAAQKELQTAVVAAFPRSKTANSAPSSNAKPESNQDETEEFEFDTIRVQLWNDKLVARLIPVEGRWTQHGIPLYQAVAKKYGINIPTKPGDYELEGSMVYSLNNEGKPRAVLSVELAEEQE